MKLFDLTGANAAAVGFRVETKADGSLVGIFSMGKMLPNTAPVGAMIPRDIPLTDNIEVHFDKPESIAVFVNRLTVGYNKLGHMKYQQEARKEAEAAEQRKQEEVNKKAELKARIENMARELSALQGEYAELPQD